jgi:hypothetical protein
MIDPKLYELLTEANRLTGLTGILVIHNQEWLEYQHTDNRHNKFKDFSSPEDFAEWVETLRTPEREINVVLRRIVLEANAETDYNLDREQIETLVEKMYSAGVRAAENQ